MAKTTEELQDAADDAAMRPKKVQTSAATIEMPTLAEIDDHIDRRAKRSRSARFGISKITRAIPPGTIGPGQKATEEQ